MLPDISNFTLDELLALRATIDTRLGQKRNALLEEAERVEGVINNSTRKRRTRAPANEPAARGE